MKIAKDVTVVPEFRLTSPAGVEMVRTHCKAWVRGKELPTPVNIKFIEWKRLDATLTKA